MGLRGPASQGPRRPLHEWPPVKSDPAYNPIRIAGTPLGVNGRHRMPEGRLEGSQHATKFVVSCVILVMTFSYCYSYTFSMFLVIVLALVKLSDY